MTIDAMNQTNQTNQTSQLEMRWVPVTDPTTGRTHMEAMWLTAAQAAAPASVTHAA